MHACSLCRRPCNCGGDTGAVISIAELPGCSCCPNKCEHGLDLDAFCGQCEVEEFVLEPDAAPVSVPGGMNGGW